MTAVLAAAVGRGYRGRHRFEQAALGARAPEPAVLADLALLPAPVLAAPVLPELVRQPELVTAASAHLSLVPVRHSADPLVDTVPHPVVRLFPVPVADPVPVPDEAAAQRTGEGTGGLGAAADALPYRSRHSA